MKRLSATEVRALDPYAFLAVLGKRVIHRGGRHSTGPAAAVGGDPAGSAGAGYRLRGRHDGDPDRSGQRAEVGWSTFAPRGDRSR
jgi:hypothetical protein